MLLAIEGRTLRLVDNPLRAWCIYIPLTSLEVSYALALMDWSALERSRMAKEHRT
jgi:hypothetical protein